MGVKLIYHNYYVGSQPVSGLLENIRNDERLRGDIKKAEVITIGVGCADMYIDISIFGAGRESDQSMAKEEVNTFRETYNSMKAIQVLHENIAKYKSRYHGIP